MFGAQSEFGECFTDSGAFALGFFEPLVDLVGIDDTLGYEDFTEFLATSGHG